MMLSRHVASWNYLLNYATTSTVWLVLVQDTDKIHVTSHGYDRPALLGTCKRIRSEALIIFYCENTFSIHMPDCDSDALMKWCDTLRALQLDMESMRANPDIGHGDLIRWKHIKVWGERVHAREAPSFKVTPRWMAHGGRTPAEVAIVEVLWTATRLREQPWSLVEELLDEKSALLQAVLPEWFRD
ncbi:uncharacterized protein CLAFUR5_13448 [Fulvia fulva]|uniref:Uncharacterized protein n=1 Tax=Passalora fulva TaxID=5499 RepID=A0A9Q8PKM2_PASFU|nr:uncharacterized protein CLAFUR5_13448 [Fulvia fulva]UJO24181.1 hypothetical protein CLAFUR5_13448 [Fulvia fulva]